MARTDYGAILSTVIKDTSDAIREVNGTSSLIAPNGWGSAIRTMHSDSDYENVVDQLIEETASGSIASFSDGANNLPCEVTCTLNPVQSGSGDPSPSNIRPITGHTELNLVHTGANIWDEEWEIGSINTSTGENLTDNTVIRTKNHIACIPNTTYYCTENPYKYFAYDKDKNYIGTIDGTRTFTTPSNCCYIRFRLYASYGTTYNNNISVNYPSTDTSYHAYNGSSHTITFPDTVYGASLGVGTGVLTTNYVKYKLGSSGWVESSGRYQHRYEGIMKAGSYYSDKGAVCDTYPKLATLASGTGLVFGYNSDYLYFYVKDDFPTLAEWTTYLENNDVYVTMPLATPTITQLTPEQLNSILGENNFYHDGNGEIQVVYKANGELYVQQHS